MITHLNTNDSKDFKAWWDFIGSGITINLENEDIEEFSKRISIEAWKYCETIKDQRFNNEQLTNIESEQAKSIIILKQREEIEELKDEIENLYEQMAGEDL